MLKIDPIIAVADVDLSAQWYQSIFGCTRTHGGSEFEVMKADGEVLICLHKWDEHEHPTMMNQDQSAGNGLILYFKTSNLQQTRQLVDDLDYPVEEDIHVNPNSNKKEFSLLDPDGYYLTVTEYHNF